MGLVEVDMTVTDEVDAVTSRPTSTGVSMCTIRGDEKLPEIRQRYLAFGDVADALKEAVEPGDTLKLFGYYKKYRWTNHLKKARWRKDFMIQRWERR